MAKNIPVTSVTPKAKVKASTEKEKASTRKTIGNIAAATMVGGAVRDVALLVKGAKAAKAAISGTRAIEDARLAKAAKEAPYPRTYKGKQGVNSDTTIQVKGTPKQTPETGAKVRFTKVTEPNSPKNVKARVGKSEARVKSADQAAKSNLDRLKGNVKRSAPGATAAVIAAKPKKK